MDDPKRIHHTQHLEARALTFYTIIIECVFFNKGVEALSHLMLLITVLERERRTGTKINHVLGAQKCLKNVVPWMEKIEVSCYS